jgi:ATP-dependent Clp protease, protease subunit
MIRQKDNLKQLLEPKNLTETSVDFYIYGDIVKAEDWKWDEEDTFPMEIRNFLDKANGRDVNVCINSGGGSVFAGMAIASMLSRYDGRTRAYIDGVCGSISTIIALSCDEIYIAEGGMWMHHQSWGGCYAIGNAKKIVDTAKEYAKTLEAINDSMLGIYESNLAEGADFEVIKKQIGSGKDTWLTADETCSFFNIQKAEGKIAVAYESDYFDKADIPEVFSKGVPKDLTTKYGFEFY